MSVAEAMGRGEEVNMSLEEGVSLVSQVDSSKAKRAKEPAGDAQVLPVPPLEKDPQQFI